MAQEKKKFNELIGKKIIFLKLSSIHSCKFEINILFSSAYDLEITFKESWI